MSSHQALIDEIVASAVACAAKRASNEDIVHGLLAGLRRLRSAVSSQAGYGAMRAFDDGIRGLLIDAAMEAAHGDETVAPPVSIPPRGPQTPRAEIILEDAAMSCLSVNAFGPGNAALGAAVRSFVAELLEQLHGAPSWAEAGQALEHGAEGTTSEWPDDGEWLDIAVN